MKIHLDPLDPRINPLILDPWTAWTPAKARSFWKKFAKELEGEELYAQRYQVKARQKRLKKGGVWMIGEAGRCYVVCVTWFFGKHITLHVSNVMWFLIFGWLVRD